MVSWWQIWNNIQRSLEELWRVAQATRNSTRLAYNRSQSRHFRMWFLHLSSFIPAWGNWQTWDRWWAQISIVARDSNTSVILLDTVQWKFITAELAYLQTIQRNDEPIRDIIRFCRWLEDSYDPIWKCSKWQAKNSRNWLDSKNTCYKHVDILRSQFWRFTSLWQTDGPDFRLDLGWLIRWKMDRASNNTRRQEDYRNKGDGILWTLSQTCHLYTRTWCSFCRWIKQRINPRFRLREHQNWGGEWRRQYKSIPRQRQHLNLIARSKQ